MVGEQVWADRRDLAQTSLTQEEDEGQKIRHELSETTQLVRAFMIADERCRNDDSWLLYKIFCLKNKLTEKDFPFEFFNAISCFETVRRIRQKLQETEPETFGPTDPKVIEKRNKRAAAFRQIFGNRGGTGL